MSNDSLAGLATAPSSLVVPPRVAASPVALECNRWQTVEPPRPDGKAGTTVVLGHVGAVFVDQRVAKDGRVDTAVRRSCAGLGYMEYAVVTSETTFTLNRPRISGDRCSTAMSEPWDGVRAGGHHYILM